MSAQRSAVRLSREVEAALADGRPVVALESTITSSFGLPAPHNRDCYERVDRAIRAAGAIPAVTGVLDGRMIAGVEQEEIERILAGDWKLAERDLPIALARGAAIGVSTVSATVAIAHLAGIRTFATGGIGGVHRGAETTFDISSDLGAMARHPVIVVSAGAKAFLDLPKTIEYLETLGVPVVGYRCSEFPAFWSRTSGISLPHRAESAAEIAAIAAAATSVGWGGGILVANPIPADAEIPAAEIATAIESGLDVAAREGAIGPAATPRILAAIAAATASRSIPANLALAESNATLAAEIAVALTR
ncbi:MAG: pseudouridine-5'-phosphate glycosidase [Chloroflexi bacterium]|nr:MAG: pseudouridine-5'-phosphate glycosidase [Chloroflexota bacterium]